jgi:hypothetical protein
MRIFFSKFIWIFFSDNKIISRERSGSVDSAASGQSFWSAGSVFSLEKEDRAAFVGEQFHTPVSQEPVEK